MTRPTKLASGATISAIAIILTMLCKECDTRQQSMMESIDSLRVENRMAKETMNAINDDMRGGLSFLSSQVRELTGKIYSTKDTAIISNMTIREILRDTTRLDSLWAMLLFEYKNRKASYTLKRNRSILIGESQNIDLGDKNFTIWGTINGAKIESDRKLYPKLSLIGESGWVINEKVYTEGGLQVGKIWKLPQFVVVASTNYNPHLRVATRYQFDLLK